MKSSHELVRADLLHVFDYFPLDSLRFVRANSHRLIRKAYRDDKGNGCLFGLLSCQLPAEQRIESRRGLIRFFTGGSSEEHAKLPEYAAPKWLVRLIDGESVARYGGLDHVSWGFVLGCLDEAIASRLAIEAESAAAEAAALERLAASEA